MTETGSDGRPASGVAQHVRVAIVGSGFAGLGTAIRLKQSGIDDFIVLERAGDVGGTWRDNSYPGCACDVPSHLYSFSFAPNPRWTRSFSPQAEIWEYLRQCVVDFDLGAHLRFGHEVREAVWDEAAARWRIETGAGSFSADVLVAGTGALSEPSVPAIQGIERFRGTRFHSAAWDHAHDLRGERVAVIGTGASAIQFVPQIQPAVRQLLVFQRTPPWIAPRGDRSYSKVERWLFERVPPAQRVPRWGVYWARESLVFGLVMDRRMLRGVEGVARRHLAEQVADRDLRRRLTPTYTIGCKRILISNDYYPALTQPNVELVTDSISEIREHSVVTADGTEREVDTMICGTGFHVLDGPAPSWIRGRGGVLLADAWRESQTAHRGTTISGFPNFFMLTGPNTGLGHTSMIFMIESQISYLLDCVRHMNATGVDIVDVRRDAQEAFNARVQERMRGTVWTSGGCRSWYLDATGKNTTLWPGFTFRFRRLTRRFDAAHYECVRRTAPREHAA